MKNILKVYGIFVLFVFAISGCGDTQSSLDASKELQNDSELNAAELHTGWIVEFDESGNEIWHEGVFATGDALKAEELLNQALPATHTLSSPRLSKVNYGKLITGSDGEQICLTDPNSNQCTWVSSSISANLR